MRNLVVFLARHYFFLLFLLLEIISVTFLVERNYYQHAKTVSAANGFTGSLYEARSKLTQYFNLREENDSLSKRMGQLLNAQRSSWMMYTSNTIHFTDTVYKQRYEYIPAEVIDNTVSRRNNYIILNRGKLQGVEPDMGVVGIDGLVGIVRDVSDNFCVVMSLLHKDVKVSASLKTDGTFGLLSWNGDDYQQAILTDLPIHSKIAKGDTLITSGLGDAFPEGVLVGTVISFEKKAGEKTYTAQINLSTDFRKLRHVFIVKDLVRDELQQLKQGIPGYDK